MNIRALWELIKGTFKEWQEDHASTWAAALSYYSVFSLPAVLVIVIAMAGFFLGQASTQQAIIDQIELILGPEAGSAVSGLISRTRETGSDSVATIIGIVTLLVSAVGLFAQLQLALNTIWEVEPGPKSGILATVLKRALSFAMILGVALLILAFLMLSSVLSAIQNFAADIVAYPPILTQILNLVLSFGVLTVLFALIYKILPDAQIAWGDVWLGAAVTALLFVLGQFALSLYLGSSNVGSAYGAAGAFVLILVWIYYSAQVFLFGAEFTQVYARKFGGELRPEDRAKRIRPGR